MEIRFLSSVTLPVVHAAFLRAFSDYFVPMQIPLPAFEDMLMRRGVDFSISPGAFVDDELIAFHINGIDTCDGVLTVYDSGSGTAPAFRRRGIAQALFDYCLPELQKRGAEQYVLEVFRQNTPAIRLYEKVGFQIVRHFESFLRIHSEATVASPSQLIVHRIEPDWDVLRQFWDWNPSWQNSIASLQRSKAARVTIGAFRNNEFAGYGIVFIETGDIPQFCVRRSDRRKGIATAIFREIQNHAPQTRLRAINIDSSDEASLRFIEGRGFQLLASQFEMKMRL